MSKNGQLVDERRLTAFFEVLQSELGGFSYGENRKVYAINRLMSRMRKRANFVRPHLKPEAVVKFRDINTSVESFSITLPDQVVRDAAHYIRVMLERYSTSVSSDNIQVSLDGRHLFDLWKFGPGASIGSKGTHSVEKILCPMACTSSCVPFVVKLRKFNPYFGLFDLANKSLGYSVVNGSRLATVPKNEETERTIAIEPLGNMALQLAAGQYLTGALKRIGLDISTQQPLNKAMACRGSMDGGVATIDLQSASDRIKIDLVRRLFPSEWFDLLMALRSPEIELPGGEVIEQHMISTMGNGFTFPLMTLVLCSLIYGYRAQRGGPTLFIDWTNTCVYGDDIILPTHEYDGYCELLTQAGFVVNNDKSYRDGPFRESCGGDYYEGYDVTPFYVETLADAPAIYVAINKVFEWCARHNCLLHQTLLCLRALLVDGPYLVPEWHNPDEGFLTSACPVKYKYLRVVARKIRVRYDHPFLLPLLCGGYVEPEFFDPKKHTGRKHLHCTYSPRPYQNEVKVKKARLPNGYLDGSDRVKRSVSTTQYIGEYAFLML